MNITKQRKELHQWIDQIEDESIIRALQSVKQSHESGDWWDDLPQSARDSIDRGLADSKAGRGRTSEEMWAELDRRRKQRA